MHPIGLLAYFMSCFILTMWSRYPWMTAIQTSCLCSIFLYHEKKIGKLLPFLGILSVVCGTNPLFVQRGVTKLFYVGNIPVTLESLLYGFHYGCLLMNVMLLFSIMNRYFRKEHWIYLSGSLFPKLGMILAMVMGLIPKYKKQAGLIMDAQKNLKKESVLKRAAKTFSIETTWAFETSMDQLDSMCARGYGRKKRTHFHLFQFEKKDKIWLAAVLVVFAINEYAYFNDYSRFFFYPMIVWNPIKIKDVIFMMTMAMQFLMPFLWKEGHNVSG